MNTEPVAYPVACLPQAWAAGSVFMMLQACLGLSIDGLDRRAIQISDPQLPIGIDRLWVEGLEVNGEELGLLFERVRDRIAVRSKGRPKTPIQLVSAA
jgi:glycogen debranching enzyme